jgi:hypothetical protein
VTALAFDLVCGDEVYGSCTELRQFLEGRGEAYVLRVASNFTARLTSGVMTCAYAVNKLLKGTQRLGSPLGRQRIEGRPLVRLGLARHGVPAAQPAGRRHLKTGELAFTTATCPKA